MRILGDDQKNELKLNDNLSGGKISVFFRMPTTAEINGYSNGMIVRKGNKVTRAVGEMRQKYGVRIMTGVGENSFGKMIAGKTVPISSDKSSPNYDPEWKELVAKQAPDVIEILAVHVFEASISKEIAEEDEPEVEEETAGE